MLNTAASVISYVSKVEDESARFYTVVSQKDRSIGKLFSEFPRENKKYETNVKRAYYNMVSDALETGFCFQDLNDDIRIPDPNVQVDRSVLLNASLQLETALLQFYRKAALAAKSLLGDLSRAMANVVRSREKRKLYIENALNNDKVQI